MHPVIKAQLQEFSHNNPTNGFSDADFFEVYSIYCILNGLLSENTDPFDAHLKGTEFGIDGCSISISGEFIADTDEASAQLSQQPNGEIEFIFFQAKSSEKYDYGEVSKFLDAVLGFYEGSMRRESSQLDELIEAKDKIYEHSLRKNPKVSCYFCTSGSSPIPDKIIKLIETNKLRLEELNLFSEIHIEIVDAGQLQALYRAATNSNNSEIYFKENNTLPGHDKVKQAYIGYIDASEIIRLATETDTDGTQRMNSSVFFDNVRDFDPKSKINKEIINELEQGDRSGFVFRNNGITVISKRIHRTGDKFLLEDFQVVNGCQTSNILFEARNHLDDVKIPFRLIESDDDDFVTSIIIGTNTQNPVRDEQFWALRPFMKNLEEYCRQHTGDLRLFIERRENQYRFAAIERTRIIKPSDVMKAVAAMFLYQPHRAGRDFRRIRSEYEGKIFQEDHNVTPYHLACYAWYKIDFFVRNGKLERSDRIYKPYMLYSVGALSCGDRSIFQMARKEHDKNCQHISSLLSDEEAFLEFCKSVSSVLDKEVELKTEGSSPVSRERVRDTLRSDTFLNDFHSKIGTTILAW